MVLYTLLFIVHHSSSITHDCCISLFFLSTTNIYVMFLVCTTSEPQLGLCAMCVFTEWVCLGHTELVKFVWYFERGKMLFICFLSFIHISRDCDKHSPGMVCLHHLRNRRNQSFVRTQEILLYCLVCIRPSTEALKLCSLSIVRFCSSLFVKMRGR